MAAIWKPPGSSKVEIKVTLETGAGWYTLAARRPSDGRQTDLRRTDSDGLADGDALFQVTPSDDAVFLLQVKCAVTTGQSGKVLLEVWQNGAIVPCQDALRKSLNGAGPYEALELGEVSPKQQKTFDFEIWS